MPIGTLQSMVFNNNSNYTSKPNYLLHKAIDKFNMSIKHLICKTWSHVVKPQLATTPVTSLTAVIEYNGFDRIKVVIFFN